MDETTYAKVEATKQIGIVCHFPPPPGGMPGQAEVLANCLRREGWEVVEIRTNVHGGKIVSALDSTRFVRTLLRFPVFLVRLAIALPRVGILHVMSCSGLSFFLFATPTILGGRLLRRKVVLHYRGGDARTFFRQWRPIVRRFIGLVDRIIVPSGFLQEIFKEEFGFHSEIVNNICELERFKKRLGGEIAPRFIVTRHLEKIYNVGCVIRAFELVKKRYKEAVLVIAGSGSEEKRLKGLVEKLGLTDSIHFLGYVDNGRIPKTYHDASIFLNASNLDNFPNSILEAFAAGLPVVTTRAGGIPYLVEDGKTGLLVDLNDHQAMARKIFLLLENPSLAQSLVTNAREDLKRYSWPEVLRQLAQIYSDEPTSA